MFGMRAASCEVIFADSTVGIISNELVHLFAWLGAAEAEDELTIESRNCQLISIYHGLVARP